MCYTMTSIRHHLMSVNVKCVCEKISTFQMSCFSRVPPVIPSRWHTGAVFSFPSTPGMTVTGFRGQMSKQNSCEVFLTSFVQSTLVCKSTEHNDQFTSSFTRPSFLIWSSCSFSRLWRQHLMIPLTSSCEVFFFGAACVIFLAACYGGRRPPSVLSRALCWSQQPLID